MGQAAEGLWLVAMVLDHTARHGSYPGPSFVPDDGQGQGATGEGNTRGPDLLLVTFRRPYISSNSGSLGTYRAAWREERPQDSSNQQSLPIPALGWV